MKLILRQSLISVKKMVTSSSQLLSSRTGTSIGNYSIASIEKRPWGATSSTPIAPKARRKAERPIVHPLFKECDEYLNDPTWKTIFNEASHGKLPRGFSFKDGYLIHKLRSRTSRVYIPTSPEEAIPIILQFFKDKGGLISEEDQRRNKVEVNQIIHGDARELPSSWSGVKVRNRDTLLDAFITRQAIKYNLNVEEKRQLTNQISIGIILGNFNASTIIVSNGVIEEIKGLVFDSTLRKFVIDENISPKNIKRSKTKEVAVINKTSFYYLWEKLISTLDKKSGRLTKKSEVITTSDDVTPYTESEVSSEELL